MIIRSSFLYIFFVTCDIMLTPVRILGLVCDSQTSRWRVVMNSSKVVSDFSVRIFDLCLICFRQ